MSGELRVLPRLQQQRALIGITAPYEWGCFEREHVIPMTNLNKTHLALLNEVSTRSLVVLSCQPCRGRSERGVTRKRELLGWGEDPHSIISFSVRGRQQKRGFREVGPVRKGLHFRSCETLSVDDNCEWISLIRVLAKHINLQKSPSHR